MDSRDPFEPSTSPGASQGGLLGSLRQMLANLVALVQVRAELLTTELSAEVQRAAGVLLWAFIALFFGGLSVLMLALTVIIAVWEGHRLLAAGLFSAVFLAVTVTAALMVRARIRSRPRLLAATLDELRRDRDALAGERRQ